MKIRIFFGFIQSLWFEVVNLISNVIIITLFILSIPFQKKLFIHNIYPFLYSTHLSGHEKGTINEKASDIVLSSLTHAFSLLCLFMSMLCSKIEFEIDINNDELLKTIWEEDTREIKPRGRG
jgi:hypothetical protein